MIPQDIVDLYNDHIDQEPSARALTSVLRSLCANQRQVFIVIDALDELDYPVRTGLLNVLENLCQDNVKVLITSRPHLLEIPADQNGRDVIQIRPAYSDIRSYLEDEIAIDARLQRVLGDDVKLQRKIVDSIAAQANGS